MKSPISLIQYHHDGYHYKIIKRSGMIGLFQQHNPGGIPVAYELIIIQANKRKEYPPASKDWGKLAWSYIHYDKAVEAFNKAIEYRVEKSSVITFMSNLPNPENSPIKSSRGIHIEL